MSALIFLFFFLILVIKMKKIKQRICYIAIGIICFILIIMFLAPNTIPTPSPTYLPLPAVPTKTIYPPQCVPPVNDITLLFSPDDISIDRPGCNHAYDLGGTHCHHFLYSKGPALWTRYDLIHDPIYLKQFLSHYVTAPAGLHANEGGQRPSHLFAVWSIARVLQPRFVIESGKYRGWGLYNLRRALGVDAILYSLDPVDRNGTYVDDNANTHYFGGTKPPGTRAHFADFTDIAEVDWATQGVVPEDTLVILDDHASVPRRIAELRPKGFRRFYIDDNAPRPAGDSLCPKYLADPRPPVGINDWTVPIYDTFGVLQRHVTYSELLRMGSKFFAGVRSYYEFPPLALHPAFFRERAKDFYTSSAQEVWEMTAEPLLSFDDPMLQNLKLDYAAINYYYCAYLEIE
jgi:hypothetical protein